MTDFARRRAKGAPRPTDRRDKGSATSAPERPGGALDPARRRWLRAGSYGATILLAGQHSSHLASGHPALLVQQTQWTRSVSIAGHRGHCPQGALHNSPSC